MNKLNEVKERLFRPRHDLIPEQGVWLRPVIRGDFNDPEGSGNIQNAGFQCSGSRMPRSYSYT